MNKMQNYLFYWDPHPIVSGVLLDDANACINKIICYKQNKKCISLFTYHHHFIEQPYGMVTFGTQEQLSNAFAKPKLLF
jgi:hypothetical protein